MDLKVLRLRVQGPVPGLRLTVSLEDLCLGMSVSREPKRMSNG